MCHRQVNRSKKKCERYTQAQIGFQMGSQIIDNATYRAGSAEQTAMSLSHRMYLCARSRRSHVITWSRAQLRDQLLKLLKHKIVLNFIPSIFVIPVHSDCGAVLSANEIFQGLSVRNS